MEKSHIVKVSLLRLGLVVALALFLPVGSDLNVAFAQETADPGILYFGGVNVEPGYQTTFRVRNLDNQRVDLKTFFYDNEGGSLEGASGSENLSVGEVREIAGQSIPSEASSLKVESGGQIKGVAVQRAEDGRKSEVIPLMPRGANQLDFPRLLNEDIPYKRIVLLNPGVNIATIFLLALDRDGFEIDRISLPALSPMGSHAVFVRDLFQSSTLNRLSAVRAVSEGELIGLQLVDAPNQDLVGLPALTPVSNGWLFPVITRSNGLTLWTRVGIYNPGDSAATVEVEAFDGSDNSLGIVANTTLYPGTVQWMETENIGGTVPGSAAILKIHSDQFINGYGVIGVENGYGLSAFLGISEEELETEGLELTGSEDGSVLDVYPVVRGRDGRIRSMVGALENGEWREQVIFNRGSRGNIVGQTRTPQTGPSSLVGALNASGPQMPQGIGLSQPTVVGQTGLWTGAASASIPIEVPTGPGGLTPSLGLVYSSDTVVDARYGAGQDDTTHRVQASPVGYGWEIDGPAAVVLVPSQAEFNDINYGYEVSLNGARFRLASRERDEHCTDHDTTVTTDYESYPQYFVEAEHIEKESHDGNCSQPTRLLEQKWVLKTPDGTEYVFGGLHSGIERNSMLEGVNVEGNPQLLRWYLTRIRDTRGNEIVFTYRQERGGVISGIDYDQAVTIDTVQYGAPRSAPTDYKFRVRFVPEASTRADCAMDDVKGRPWRCDGSRVAYPPVFRSYNLIDYIVVEAKNASGNWETLRTYDLGYNVIGNADRAHSLLTTVLATRAGTSLPPYIMAYYNQDTPTAFHNWAPLRSIDNGYGGKTEFDYQEFTFTAKHFSSDRDTPPNENYTRTRQRVAQRRVYDRGQLASRSDYSYGSAMGSEYYATNYDGIYSEWYEFLGHSQVTETVKSSTGATVQETRTDFLQKLSGPDNCPEPHPARGQVLSQSIRESATAPTLNQIENTWQVTESGAPPLRIKWGWLEKKVEKWDAGQPSEFSRVTKYGYDPARQNGTQYGNVTDITEYASLSDYNANKPYRKMAKTYIVNSTAWITNRVQLEQQLDRTGTEQARTEYYYDRNVTGPTGTLRDWAAAPTRGDVVAVRRVNVNRQGPDALEEYWYDDYGNRIKEKDPNGNITQTSCDTLWNVLPIRETNAKGHVTELYYYGVNGTTPVPANGFAGDLERMRDPNAVDTYYRYDAFGRLAKIIRPGDDDTKPTVIYAYFDNRLEPQTPTMRASWQKTDPNATPWGTGGTYVREFYDGLGRLIQTQTPYQNWGGSGVGQEVVRNITYDTLGRRASESVAYLKPAYTSNANCNGTGRACSPYVAPDMNKPKTTYLYDALGRVTSTTYPDNTITSVYYRGSQRAVIDGNRHLKVYSNDAFGRLQGVKEFTGDNSSPIWDDLHPLLYATTVYFYNELDKLTKVLDAENNLTTIYYDSLGRKISMIDPDMGMWSYGYDGAGNLKRQTDARGQTVCYFYDELNRLKGKTYQTSQTCPTTDPGSYLITYSYDSTASGNKGLGRRTGMSDPSGSASYTFDTRGRLLREAKTITGASAVPFVTNMAYDSADRMTRRDYPDGEQVSTTYNAQGLPNTLKGSQTGLFTNYAYVSSSSYNAAGQDKSRTLGTSPVLTTWWGYFGYSAGEATGDSFDETRWARQNYGRLSRICTGANQSADCVAPPTGSTNARQDLTYWYDKVGNVTAIRDYSNGGQVQYFFYDELDRMTSGYTDGSGQGTYSTSDSYTPSGNIDLKDSTLKYRYDPAHKHAVTSVGPVAPSSPPVSTYSYDANGQQVLRSGTDRTDKLVYDAESRLAFMLGTNATTRMVYDGDGERVQQVVYTNNGATLFSDAFSYLNFKTWVVSGHQGVISDSGNTVLTNTGTGNDFSANLYRYGNSGKTDMSVTVEFKLGMGTGNIYDALALENSTGTYRWGVVAQGNRLYVQYRINNGAFVYPQDLLTNLEAKVWYVLTLRADTRNGFTIEVYRKDNPAVSAAYSYPMPLFLSWRFRHWIYSNTTYLDNYVERSQSTQATVYVGPDVEYQGTQVTKTYQLGGKRVALRQATVGQGGTIYYVLGDHLGSSHALLNTGGVKVAQELYQPYGGKRYEWLDASLKGALPTNRKFTGQVFDSTTGLYYYGARYYDPSLGRFVQPDSLIPNPGSSQDWNRYSYVRNNPLKYVDSDGHVVQLVAAVAIGAVFNVGWNAGAAAIEGYRATGTLDGALQEVKAYATPENIARDLVIGAVSTLACVGIGNVAGKVGEKLAPMLMESGAGQAVAEAGGKIATALKGAIRGRLGQAARTVFSGHGGLVVGDSAPATVVPEGTTLTVYAAHGKTILDALGNAIETGMAPEDMVAKFGDKLTGARSYLSGAVMPDYTLYPPRGLNIMGNPITVLRPTPLSRLLRPNMGHMHWAACLSEVIR